MENKYIRLLIDNARFFMTESAEEIEYTRISPSRTGLPYDIYIDNNRSYKKHNHELWLYVKCDGVKIPITIEDKPKVKRFAYGLKCDLSPVYEFIRINKEILINMANRNTNEHVFFHLLQSVSENAVSKNDKYNYIKSDGTMLFKETDLDYAGNFTYYDEDILLAFVVKDGREFYINDKGEEVKFE